MVRGALAERAGKGSKGKPISAEALATGQRLRGWRKYRHMSQVELAQYLGVSPTIVGLWERGQRKIRHVQMLRLALQHWDCRHPKEDGF